MKYLLLIATAVIAILFLFWKDVGDLIPVDKLKAKDGGGKDKLRSANTGIEILQQWNLPEDLKEVSGIAWLDDERFAAVQDESGTIFIFNRVSGKIEKQISFSGAGDYEALAVKHDTAYIATAGGSIYEVVMNSAPARVREFTTTLTNRHNVEGLCYDAAQNRLLMTVKDHDPTSKDYKGVYAFSLQTMQFSPVPVFKIERKDPLFSTNKKSGEMMPSAIGIHPITKNIYIADGPNARLLVLDPEGKAVKLIDLGKKFAQPEGITFSPAGGIFISNEGNKEPGNIIEVKIDQ